MIVYKTANCVCNAMVKCCMNNKVHLKRFKIGAKGHSRRWQYSIGHIYTHIAFSALTLLAGHQEEHLAHKKSSDEVPAWHRTAAMNGLCILPSS